MLTYIKENMNTMMREIESIKRNEMELIAIKQYNVLHSNSLEGLKED